MTHMVLLGSDKFEFRAVIFCPMPQNDDSNFTFTDRTMLGSENFELSCFALY